MTLFRSLPALVLAAAPLAATAQDTGGVQTFKLDGKPFTYEIFEAAVPHSDLAACPGGLSNDDYFCRVTLAGDATNIFVFRYDGDLPLVEVRSYPLDGGFPAMD